MGDFEDWVLKHDKLFIFERNCSFEGIGKFQRA